MTRAPLFLLAALALGGCTDAATRLAYQFEHEASSLRSDPKRERLTFEHTPNSSPEGPRGDYRITLDPGGLTVWCVGQTKDYGDERYSTSYHRRFVKVPNHLEVSHHAGEASKITIEKQGDAVVVTAAE